MSYIEEILSRKKWKIDQQTRRRLVSLIEKFVAIDDDTQREVVDIEQFSSYFVTHVYKLICKESGSLVNYYAKFAYLPKGHEKRQRERIKYEYDYTVQIYDVFKDNNLLDSVKPVAYFHEEGCFVMAEMQGTRLDTLLVSSMKIFSASDPGVLYESMKGAGRWLAEFQSKMPIEGEIVFTAAQLEQRIALYLDKVSNEKDGLISTELGQNLAAKTTRLLNAFRPEDFTRTAKHNDYAPWNLMHGDSGIIGFDYADCEFDSQFYDVYHYTRALNTFKLKPIKNINVIEKCKQEFLNGYGKDIPIDHPTRLYFNLFFSLERVQMLLRARKRNTGFVGKLKTLSQKRHMNFYLNELKNLAKQ